MKNTLASLTLVGLLAACASTTPAPVENKAPDATPTPSTNNSNTSTQPVQPSQGSKLDPLNDPASMLSKRGVYFDYDKYDVRADQQALVEAHGRYLAANPGRSVRVEGNADERGSREYNLALGQKRAEAVRKALSVVGAKDGQIEATSNGEEKPRATDKDEASYAENRRADMVYNGE
ncbi:peptidoglycan-associated lipoprotein Pal [Chitinimonas sp. JJ19]|uniref:peptidoglycan-associated lipoprotein Pal n=1 Tax=Chitinimonas sp. JJ19 TaxID=3109352 RepID=UPI003001D2E7